MIEAMFANLLAITNIGIYKVKKSAQLDIPETDPSIEYFAPSRIQQ